MQIMLKKKGEHLRVLSHQHTCISKQASKEARVRTHTYLKHPFVQPRKTTLFITNQNFMFNNKLLTVRRSHKHTTNRPKFVYA